MDGDTKESIKVPIVRYDSTGGRQIYVEYIGNEIPITTTHIGILKGNKISDKYIVEFRFQIGDVINNIEIIDGKNEDNCKKQSTKSIKIGNLYQMKSFQCICNDNISYGENFFISFLEQQKIYYIHQYRYKDFNKFYNFYLPSLNEMWVHSPPLGAQGNFNKIEKHDTM